MAFTYEDIADLVAITDRKKKKGAWGDLWTDLRKFVALRVLKEKKVKFQGGNGYNFKVMTSHAGTAQAVGMFNVDSHQVTDHMADGYVPHKFYNDYCLWDTKEVAINSAGPDQIIDLIETREKAKEASYWNEIESDFWSKPTDSADDLVMFGLFYWIVKNATAGFNGGDPAGFSGGAAGLPVATYPRYQNYTDTYADFSEGDCVEKLNIGWMSTGFESPIQHPTLEQGPDDCVFYTTMTAVLALQRISRERNDNLGYDLANQTVRFNRCPVVEVPRLTEDDSTNPIYMVNWSVLYPAALSGYWMMNSKPYPLEGTQHTVVRRDWDTSMQLVCVDRRRNAVLYQA